MRRHRLLSILLLAVGAGVGVMIGGLPESSSDLSVEVQGSTLTSPPTTVASGEPVPAAEPVAPQRGPSELKVLVLNATDVRGIAGDLSGVIEGFGYQVLEPGNAPTQTATQILYTAGFEAEGEALAAHLDPQPAVQPIADTEGLPDVAGAHLVVVIGSSVPVATTTAPPSSTSMSTSVVSP